jgi:hypothetical protein
MKTITTLFAVIAMSFAPQLVSAQQGMGMGAPDFATMDADSDGELSAEELAALPFVQSGNVEVDQLLTNWDTDSSGTVSEAEFNSRAMGMGMG